MLNFMTMAFDVLHNEELLLLGFMFVFGLFVFVLLCVFFSYLLSDLSCGQLLTA